MCVAFLQVLILLLQWRHLVCREWVILTFGVFEMKFFNPVLVAILALATTNAYADTFTLTCKSTPSILSSIKKALELKVQSQVDINAFTNTKTSVGMKLLTSGTTTAPISLDQLLAGINVHDSGDPTGLAFGVGGNLNLSDNGSCIYTYRVSVNVRGTDKVSGDKITTRTESIITITTPPLGNVKKSAN